MSCTDDHSQPTLSTEKPTLRDFRLIRFVRRGGDLHEFVAATFRHQVLSSSELKNEPFLTQVTAGMKSAEIRDILVENGFDVSVETNLDGYYMAIAQHKEMWRRRNVADVVSANGKIKSKKNKTKGRLAPVLK